MYSLIKSETNDRRGLITLNRPEKKNALNPQLISELKEALHEFNDDHQMKVVIIKAAGDVFCAGADLEYVQQLQKNSFEENLKDSNHLKELFLQIYTHRLPIIAMVQGHAIAGGCGLATVCDFIFTVPKAKFGYSEVRIGFIPALVLVFLLRKIGETRARELLLGGKLINAEQALDYELVNFVVEKDDIENEVEKFAGMLVEQNSGASMEMTKSLISKVWNMPLEAALDLAAEMNAKARETEDCKKGIQAFLDKVKITW